MQKKAEILSAATLAAIDCELKKYPKDQARSAVMSALRLAQQEFGWLSEETMTAVAAYLKLSPIEVYEVATFYNMFHTKSVGKHHITVCTNLPCALQGSCSVANYLKEKLNIGFNETTPDGQFSLGEGECFGACGDAPVLLYNNHRMCSRMGKVEVDEFLAGLET